MKNYENLTRNKIEELANNDDITIVTIMTWYRDADSTQERVDMIMLMKERIKVCNTKNKIW